MKRLYSLIIFLILGFQINVFSQATAEDSCVNAIELTDLDDFCDVYLEGSPTYDGGTSNCADPLNMPNVWFKFTAIGTEVTIRADMMSGEDAVITLGRFVGGDCLPPNFGVVDCTDDGVLNFNGLTIGQMYFIALAFNPTDPNERMRFCIDNQEHNGPPNDDPCDAIFVSANNGCATGTTVDAMPDWIGTCQPPTLYENSVYYRTTISPGNNTLTATVTGLGEGAVMILDFDGNCNGTPSLLAQDCGLTPLEAVAQVEAGKTYYIAVSSSEDDEGTFTVCLEETGPPPGCSENDLCNDAEPISPNPIVHNDPNWVCADGCNIGATGGMSFGNCIPADWSTVYFTFTGDGQSERATITVNSNDPGVGSIAVAIMTNCTTYIDCERGANGSISLDGINILPNTTYIVVVATPPTGTGEFEVCVKTFHVPDGNCVGANEMDTVKLTITGTSMGSPPGGPYEPGEEVTFRYEVPNYQRGKAASSQWIHGIVPIFGTGWDPASFDAQGRPIISTPPSGNATWNWYPDGYVTYKGTADYYTVYTDTLGMLGICYFTDPMCPNDGIVAGTGLPSGWFAYSNSPSCPSNGDPNNGYGDSKYGPWIVNFTLKVRPLIGPESCTETGYIDCSVKIFTFGDKQTGCWPGGSENACAADEYTSQKGITNCCEGPEIDPYDETICSGDQTSIELTSNLDPDVTYTWTVSSPTTVSGAADGSGKFIAQRLTNSSNSPQIVTYTVIGTYGPNSCPGQSMDILVTVLPEVVANAGEPIDGCAQVDFTLGGSPTGSGGSGNYTYQWNNGAGTSSNPTVRVNATTTFRVTVTDEYGCEATDEVTIEVMDAVLFDIEGDLEFCENTSTELSINPISGMLPYTTWEWEGPGGFYSTSETIEVFIPGTYSVTITDANGCDGENEITIEMIDAPYVTIVPDEAELCPEYTMNIQVMAGTYTGGPFDVLWQTPDGERDDLFFVTDKPGTYIVTVTDEFGCETIDSLVVTEAEVPEPVILGESVICEGDFSVLSVEGTYMFYMWSTGESSTEIAVNTPGEYSVTVSSLAGCYGSGTFTVELDQSTVSFIEEPAYITCADEEIQLSGVGSSTGAEYSYSWSTSGGHIVHEDGLEITVDKGGTYTLLVTNTESGCEAEYSVEVEYDQVAPVVDVGSPQDFDCATSSISVGGNGSSSGPEFNYAWTTEDGTIASGGTSAEATVTEPGTYVLTIINQNNGCMAQDSVVIGENTLAPTIDSIDAVVLTCSDPEQTIASSVTTQGTAIYSWTSTTDNIEGASDQSSVRVNGAGVLTLTVTDDANSCTETIEVTVTEDQAAPVADAGDEMTLSCVILSVELDGSGSDTGAGYTYQWTTADGNIVQGADGLNPEVDLAGTYTLTVTNTENGCSASSEVLVHLDAEYPDVDAGQDAELTCVITEIQLDASAGTSSGSEYTYQWRTTDGNIIEGGTGLKPLVDKDGTYTLVVVNTTSGCVDSSSVVVSLNITAPDAVVADADEFGCDTESMTLDGSGSSVGADYTYSWTGNPGLVLSGGNSLSPVIGEPGTYTLTVTDRRNGCSTEAQVIVGQSADLPIVDAGENKLITCDEPEVQLNGSASSGVGGTLDYHWNALGGGNIVSGENTLTPIVDAPGFYELWVIDLDNGCENTSTIEVRDSINAPAITSGSEYILTCENPEAELDATTGTASSPTIVYEWKTEDGHIVGDNTRRRVTVDAPGTYTFIVVDQFTGCKDSVDFTVVLDQGYPTVSISGVEILTCARDVITLDARASSQGGSFEGTWTASNGGVVSGDADAYTLEVSVPGTYTFTVTNTENGCVESMSVVVEEDKQLPGIDPIAEIVLTCTTPDYTITATTTTIGDPVYSWTSTTGNISGASNEQSVLVTGAGILTLTVTDDANSCSTTIEVKVIDDKDPPIADAGAAMTLTCDATTVTLDGSGSSIGSQYTYSWSSPDGGNIVRNGNTLTPEVDVAATYILTVTNTANGCSATSEVKVNIDEDMPKIQFESVLKLTCARETVNINAEQSSKGSNFEYKWSTTDGRIESENGLVIEVSRAGTYTLTIINTDNNCEAVSSVTVEEDKEAPHVEIVTPDILDCVVTSITIDGSNSSSGAGYAAKWTTTNGRIVSGADSYRVTVDKVGEYTLTITNLNNGCTSSVSVVVQASEETPVADAGPDLVITCVDTILTINASNSSIGTDFTSQWITIGGNIVSGADGLTPVVDQGGMYILIVSNTVNNCEARDTMTVRVEQSYPDLNYTVSNEITCRDEDALITARVGNAARYTVEWYYEGAQISGATSTELRVREGGIYTLVVENTESFCVSSIDIEVKHNTNVIRDAELRTINPSCEGDVTGCVVITEVIGGEAPYSVYVDDVYKGNHLKVCGISVGEHSLRIEDKNGCTMDFSFEIEPAGSYYVSLGETYEISKGDSLSLTYETNIPRENIATVSWDWTMNADLDCSSCDTITISPEQTVKILIEIVDVNGCVFIAFANVLVRKDIKVYVPTVFTPNGDGQNDILTVYAAEEVREVLYFEIYNRWGERVFYNENFTPNDESAGWDGSFRGQPMQPAVFMYKVEVLMDDGSIVLVKGTTSILL